MRLKNILAGSVLDLLRAVAGVAHTGDGANWEDGARRLVDVLMAGIRVSDGRPIDAAIAAKRN